MKIVINAASAKMGGAASYITNLLRQLPPVAEDIEFLVLLPPKTAVKLQNLDRNIRLLPIAIGHVGALRRMWWEQVTLRRILKRQRADALFSTGNFAMFLCPVHQLLLVRNALYFSKFFREMFLPKQSLRYRLAFALRRWLIGQSARAADVVMTPSQFMLDELRGYAEVENAAVNPYGVSLPELREKRQQVTAKTLVVTMDRAVRLLFVSLYSEHKNLSTLLKALAILNRTGGRHFKLKTTADPGWTEASVTVTCKADMKLARESGIEEHVEFVGPLSHERTQDLYAESDIFVFPSLTESFGFPMAEAMAHGLPIIAADTTVNREICGAAAIYFDPLRPEDLAEKVWNLAADLRLSAALSARGRTSAAVRYSWGNHVRRLVESAGALKTEYCRPSTASSYRKLDPSS